MIAPAVFDIVVLEDSARVRGRGAASSIFFKKRPGQCPVACLVSTTLLGRYLPLPRYTAM